MEPQGDIEAVYRLARAHAGAAAPTPVHAAVAVVPWRTANLGGIEVFLVERAASLRFLGGFRCFPGGRVDPQDLDELDAARRELAEETGIRIGRERLTPAARFVTPDLWPLRFDATYYLAELVDGEHPDAAESGGELTGGEWIAPAAALARFADGEWLLPTPVLGTLRALASGLDGADARLAAEAAADAADPYRWPLAGAVEVLALETPTLPPARHTGCYLIGDREVVAIDPGSPYPPEQARLAARVATLASEGRRLIGVFLTHHHGDHVGGAAALARATGAPIRAHAETFARLPPDARARLGPPLVDGEVVELAGEPPRRLRAIFTPGHAPGHLCFHEEVTGFVAAGDMVASEGTILIDPGEGDMAHYLASLERLAALGARALLPAHGAPIADPATRLADYVSHRLWREGRVLDALALGPAPAGELVARAYADTSAALHGLAERSLLAHLAKLAAEGRARRDRDVWSLG